MNLAPISASATTLPDEVVTPDTVVATQPLRTSMQASNASSEKPAPATTGASPTSEQMQAELADALKKVGIKADIEDVQGGYIVVKYIDSDSNRVMFQVPAQTVLDLVANLSSAVHESDPSVAGAMIDQLA